MRIFHLSDLHIGLRLMNHDLTEDQVYIFEQIASLAKEYHPDVIVIAGDIYDKTIPSAEAVELFDDLIRKLTETLPECEIMMISGNHDSAKRVNVFRSVLKKQHIHMIGEPPVRPDEHIEQVTLEDAYGKVHFYLLPFVRSSMVRLITGEDEDGGMLSYNEAVHRLIDREQIADEDRNVLVSHQFYLPAGTSAEEVERMDSEICTVGNIDEVRSDILERFDYAALGHIHKPMKVGGDQWRYCGTPIPCSVTEAGQKKGIIMVDLAEKGVVQTQVLPLRPLREIRVISGEMKEVLKQGCLDYVSVVLTDKDDLDAAEMQDRLRDAFPHLLEIRRETGRSADYSVGETVHKTVDPFEVCCAFLNDPDEKEKALLQDVINTVKERV